MDFDERLIPGVSANYLYQEGLARYEFAKKRIENDALILDLGCGTGYGTDILSDCGQVVGVDKSKDAISFARKKYKGNAFLISDVYKLPFKSKKFDCVVSFELIEHLKYPSKYLLQVKKVLKSDGVFIVSTPNLYYKKDTISSYHEKEYSGQEFYTLLKKKFKVVEIYTQNKSKRATLAHKKYMQSQSTRQNIVDIDIFKFRRLIPKSLKEYFWLYIGAYFGRHPQDLLISSDFPIKKANLASIKRYPTKAEYYICVCKNE